MDFDGQGLMQEEKVHPFEEYGEEDDVLFDELRRQILQLTADEDEDVYEAKIMNAIEARKQGPFRGAPQPICYFSWPGTKEDCAAAAATPAWMVNLWRSANGTGVFIPQGVQPRRKNRSRAGRKNDRGSRSYRRVDRMMN